jgi:hypothetical protein
MPISNLELSRAVPNANPGFDLGSQRSTPGPDSLHSPFRPQNLSNIFSNNVSFTPLVDMLKTVLNMSTSAVQDILLGKILLRF